MDGSVHWIGPSQHHQRASPSSETVALQYSGIILSEEVTALRMNYTVPGDQAQAGEKREGGLYCGEATSFAMVIIVHFKFVNQLPTHSLYSWQGELSTTI